MEDPNPSASSSSSSSNSDETNLFLESLPEDQRVSVALFSEINDLDPLLSFSLLESSNWNLELAVSNFLNDEHSNTSSVPNINEATESPQPSGLRRRGQNSSSSSSSSTTASNLSENNQNNTYRQQESSGFFGVILDALGYFIKPHSAIANPHQDTLQFLESMNRDFIPNHSIPFLSTSYTDACKKAMTESKLLLIYLHSPLHEDTADFCQKVLNSEVFLDFISSNNLLVWGGDVSCSEAFYISNQLSVTSFPFLSVFLCETNNSVKTCERIQGNQDNNPGQIVQKLETSISSFRTSLDRKRTEKKAKDDAQRLREEQDREYQEMLRQEEIQLKELKKKEEEKKRQQELEEQLRIEEERLEKERKENYVNIIESYRELVIEPQSSPDLCSIRFCLPNQKKITRKFLKSQTTDILYKYIRVYFFDNKIEIPNFSISTSFPKVEIPDLDQESENTLEKYSLYPSSNLYITDLDA